MYFKYLTSKRYPSSTADHFYVRHMAEAFTRILGDKFSLFVSGGIPEELKGVNTVSVRAPKHFRSVFYFFWIFLTAIRDRKKSRETVYFSNDPNLLTILIFWKKTFGFKYKICSDWHQLFRDPRDRYIARNSDCLISTSQNLKKLIIGVSGVNENKILVAYGGVDINNFQFPISNFQKIREELGFLESDFLVGYVGFYKTMGMSKGIDTMLSALALIPDKKVKMLFVGGKADEIVEYEAIAEVMGVKDRVIFVGVVPNGTIPSYEVAVDTLVIPYPNKPHFRDFGFPMKVYEYMASGRPIIYSNLPIMSEVLGDCAIPFEPDNPSDLAEKIEGLISEPEKGIELAQKALKKVENFTWEKRVQKILNFVSKDTSHQNGIEPAIK